MGLNVGFALLLVVGVAAGGDDNPRLLYLLALFAICSSPVLYADGANGRYTILLVMAPLLFLYYGVSDLLRLIPGLAPPASGLSTGVLSPAEAAALLGIGLLVLGYRTAVTATGRGRKRPWAIKDWRRGTVVGFGLVSWALGIAATWFWQTEVVERYVGAMTLGASQAIPLLILRLLQPLSIGLLAYALVSFRSRSMTLMVIAILVMEFIFGFIADSKELAIRSTVIVIVGKFLLEGRVPRQWVMVAGLVIALTFGVFQAYRFEVLQTGKQTRAEAAENFGENVDKALGSDMLQGGLITSGIAGFAGRVNLKPTLELIIARVGNDVAYQGGSTLVPILTSFIPRIIWPDKPDSSAGQLFNREFRVSADPDTYISPSHLGEMYWNFGWAGLVLGLPAIGFLLGFVNSRFALSEGRSLTRFLVLVTTVYLLCMRFEGGTATTYIVWIRSLALIGLLHMAFAKVSPRPRRAIREYADDPDEESGAASRTPLVRTAPRA